MIFCHHLSIMSLSLSKPLKRTPSFNSHQNKIFCLLLCPSSTFLFFCFAHHSLFPSAVRHKLFAILLPLLFSSLKICYCCLLKRHTHRFPFKADHFFLSKLHFLELSCNYLLLCIYTCFCMFKNSCAFIAFFALPVVRKFLTEGVRYPSFLPLS